MGQYKYHWSSGFLRKWKDILGRRDREIPESAMGGHSIYGWQHFRTNSIHYSRSFERRTLSITP